MKKKTEAKHTVLDVLPLDEQHCEIKHEWMYVLTHCFPVLVMLLYAMWIYVHPSA